jgi:hypothetical protein
MDEFVLITDQETYFVEYLLGSLVLSSSISEAMVFDDYLTASKFRNMLSDVCDTKCSINTFIN